MTDGDSTADLKSTLRKAQSLRESMLTIYEADDIPMVMKFNSCKEYLKQANKLAEEFHYITGRGNELTLWDVESMPSPHDMPGVQQKEVFDHVWANLNTLIAILEETVGEFSQVNDDIQEFLTRNLRSAVSEEPQSEKEVQDTVESLLIGKGLEKGEDWGRETGRVKVSSKEVVPDFIFMKIGMALEIKFVSSSQRESQIIDEINGCIEPYSKEYSDICFLVYDIGFIQDEEEFRRDLEYKNDVSVLVIKH